MRSWQVVEGKLIEVLPCAPGDSQHTVVIWFHDESTFYVHNRRKKAGDT